MTFIELLYGSYLVGAVMPWCLLCRVVSWYIGEWLVLCVMIATSLCAGMRLVHRCCRASHYPSLPGWLASIILWVMFLNLCKTRIQSEERAPTKPMALISCGRRQRRKSEDNPSGENTPAPMPAVLALRVCMCVCVRHPLYSLFACLSASVCMCRCLGHAWVAYAGSRMHAWQARALPGWSHRNQPAMPASKLSSSFIVCYVASSWLLAILRGAWKSTI